MCYTAKLGKYGLASLGLIGPGAVDIPADRVSVSDLPPTEQIIVVPQPEPVPETILVEAVPTTAQEETPVSGRLPAPDRIEVVGGRRAIYDRRCRPGFCNN